MKQKNAEMRLLYAAPRPAVPGGEDGRDDGERREYPENYMETPDDERGMVDVYAGPGMMGELDGEPEEPVPDGEPEPQTDAPREDSRPRRPAMRRTEMFEAVYAGPPPQLEKDERMMARLYDAPRPDARSRRPIMMAVYAGPEVMANMHLRRFEGDTGSARFCPICGTKTIEGANYCTECGARLPEAGTPGGAPAEGEAPGNRQRETFTSLYAAPPIRRGGGPKQTKI